MLSSTADGATAGFEDAAVAVGAAATAGLEDAAGTSGCSTRAFFGLGSMAAQEERGEKRSKIEKKNNRVCRAKTE